MGRFVIDLLEALEERSDESPGDVITSVLLESDSELSDWPTDAEVVKALGETPLYGAISQARMRMMLEALEDDRRTPLTEEAHCQRGLTIEHVMPQGWREHWQLAGLGHPEVESAKRDSVVHRLGNLTLVNNRLNPSLSNRPWTDIESQERGLGENGKRSILDEHSVLLLNHQIVHENIDAWDEACIEARGKMLAQRIVHIWPRPDLA